MKKLIENIENVLIDYPRLMDYQKEEIRSLIANYALDVYNDSELYKKNLKFVYKD